MVKVWQMFTIIGRIGYSLSKKMKDDTECECGDVGAHNQQVTCECVGVDEDGCGGICCWWW